MESNQEILKDYHIISLYDIENFIQISKKLDSPDIFRLMNELQKLIIGKLKDADPIIIKNIGDSNLMVFKTDNIDDTIKTLYTLKDEIEDFLKTKGFHNKISFSTHYGEITTGMFGIQPFQSMDAFGDPINIAFMMNGKPFRGRFTISPQLFRKLNKETRKIFHKYTAPIVYIAD
jgi:class 3 adenylate cyclase